MEDASRTSFFWQSPAPQSVESAILCTLAYADLFDYPLTAAEVHRYLVGIAADLPTVESLLINGRTLKHVVRSGTYFTLPGRERIVDTRMRRAQAAPSLWRDAIRCGQAIARMPFVRMVAVTGALARDNADPGDDVDYLIITSPDRLWLCRALIIQFVVKPAAHRGIAVCPNYLLSERALALSDHNLFTAHEIVQMVPVAGRETYRRMCQLNQWAAEFLPNAYGRPRSILDHTPMARAPWINTEPFLRSPVGGWLERWEMKRKIRKFDRQNHSETEASFSSDWCKGHFESHGQLVRDIFFRRLKTLND